MRVVGFPADQTGRMPAGLDGHPHPIRTAQRHALLSAVADRVCSQAGERILVAVDGGAGSGKSTFAGELALVLGARGMTTDTSAEQVVEVATNAVLVFDGLFLHRPEFVSLWDVSVLLDADERRDEDWLSF